MALLHTELRRNKNKKQNLNLFVWHISCVYLYNLRLNKGNDI